MKQIPQIDILYYGYSRNKKKKAETVILCLCSKDIVKPVYIKYQACCDIQEYMILALV